VLELADVHTYYGESHILQGVSLDVGAGQVVAILGRNGAGKTTLVRTTIGFTPARRGTVRFKGDDITRWPSYRAVERGMALVPQRTSKSPGATAAAGRSCASWTCSPGSASAGRTAPTSSPAASSRCWPSGAR
jgi:ABC-type multidrug transport system ATPase subunit